MIKATFIKRINEQLQSNGLLVKKGILVDASIFLSSRRPFSKTKSEALAEQPSSQIDTDAMSTRRGRTFYFGYKGHIGVDVDIKVSALQDGWYYGVLDRAKRGEPLSSSQKKRNRKHSRVRAAEEHPFAWMKTKANLVSMRAKNAQKGCHRLLLIAC